MVFSVKEDGFKRNLGDRIYLASISLTDHKQCEYKVPEKDQYFLWELIKMNQKPDSNPDEKARILLLAGFLGSGKTTLLKRILSWEADLSDSVVLVNEFGDVGIDGALLKDSGSDVVELTSGCICCTLSADLKLSLEDIWKRFQPKRIFIESSGVADPASIVQVLQEPRLMQTM